MFTDQMREYYGTFKYLGKLPRYSYIGKSDSSFCGDTVNVFIEAEQGVVTDAKCLAFGCPTLYASVGIICERLIGKPIECALNLSANVVCDWFGLPTDDESARCVETAVSAFNNIIPAKR